MQVCTIFLIAARPRGEFQGDMVLFASLFVLLSLVMLVFGLRLLLKRKDWLAHSKLTYGKIVEITKRYARDDHSGRFPIYFPIVSYQVNGLEFRREVERGHSKQVQLGQEVPVRYFPENPMEASLDEQAIPVLNPTIFFILGGMMLISALLLLLAKMA